MGKFWVGILAFAGGVTAGLLYARQHAKDVVGDDISKVLGKVGLGGGKTEEVVKGIVVPLIG